MSKVISSLLLINVFTFDNQGAIFAAISNQGLSFFPTQNFYREKQNTRPKRKRMHDTLALQWFSVSRNDKFVFF